jgi:hypothetical protein
MFRIKQVKDILGRSDADLTAYQGKFRDILTNFDTNKKEHRTWLEMVCQRKFVFWKPDIPGRLRYEGDGCAD